MDAITCLKTRRSVRQYDDRPIPRETLEDIVDCARLAPSATNRQPWTFVVVTDREMLTGLADITDYGKHIASAAACIVVFCEDVTFYVEDGSAATTNILHAAWAHGIGSCWVSGDKRPYVDEVRDILGVPESYRLVSLNPLGYPAEDGAKKKRELDDVIHWERF
ncbi:nitroreductase family protein [Candidatus Poribacteria bacterium]|nr:nitroreductase family protein [Candidatus Poribacteria bacterium]